MVGLQLPKLITWVRFPSPAPLAAHRCMPRTPRPCRLEHSTRQWLPRFYPHTHLKHLHQPPGKRPGAVVASPAQPINKLHGDCACRSHVPPGISALQGLSLLRSRLRTAQMQIADWPGCRLALQPHQKQATVCKRHALPGMPAARQWLRDPIAPGRPRLAAPARHRRHCPFRSGQPR